MFNKLKTIKKFSNEYISINSLLDITKCNPQNTLIEKIRSVEYKSKEYNSLKLGVKAITPHGIFSSLKNSGLIQLSGYLYYDIDGFDTEKELNDTKQKLIETNYVSFICKSVGGRGLSFLIKYDTKLIPNDTFIDIYNYVRSILIGDGFNIDVAAGGLVRKMIISSDRDVYFNNDAYINIDLLLLNKFKSNLKGLKKIREKRKEHIIPNDTFFQIIELGDLLKEIKIETLYSKEIDGDFIIEEMDYYKIILPKIIGDGTKHKLYIRIINALYYLNNNITHRQIYSYLFHINNMAKPKMNEYKLQQLVINICNNIESTGEIRIKPRIKRLHFNKESKLTKNQKQSMGAQLGAKIKNNRTIELINEAKLKIASRNELPTQKLVSFETGLSIATVKRNWNKELNDLNDIKVKNEKETIIENNEDKMIVVEEEEFFVDYTTPKSL